MERLTGTPYLVGETLGRGPHGVVLAGQNTAGQPCAIKVLDRALTPDSASFSELDRWRTGALRLRHDHVVAVQDVLLTEDSLAIVSDRVDGGDLAQALVAVRSFPPAEACRLGAQLARGLAAVHALGMVHGGLSARNVLFDVAARRPSVLIGDVGLAGWLRHAAGLRVPIGGHPYAAPEVVTGALAGPASDLYALGVLLYEMCAGEPPFTGDGHEVLRLHAGVAPRRPAHFPERLWVLVAALLAKNPAARPGPAGQIAGYLDAIGVAVAAVPPALAPARPVVVAPIPVLAPPPPAAIGADDETMVFEPRVLEPIMREPVEYAPGEYAPVQYAPVEYAPVEYVPAAPPPVEVVTTVLSARTRQAQAAARQRRAVLITALAVVLPLLLIVGVRTLTGAHPVADETVANLPGNSDDELTPDQYRADVPATEPGPPATATSIPLAPATPTPTPTPRLEDQIAALADLARRQGGAVVDADDEGVYRPSDEAGDRARTAGSPAPGAARMPAARPTARPAITSTPPATPRPTSTASARPGVTGTPKPAPSMTSGTATSADSAPDPGPGGG